MKVHSSVIHSFTHTASLWVDRFNDSLLKFCKPGKRHKRKSVEGGGRGNLIPIPYLTLGTTITAAPTALATLATLASHSVWAPTSSPWSHCLIWWQPVDIDSSQEWRRRKRRRHGQRKALFHGHFHISNGVLWVCLRAATRSVCRGLLCHLT